MVTNLSSNLNEALYAYIKTPFNPEANFNLGVSYELLGQTASASSFYLRAAEKTLDKNLQYCALLRNAHCFELQGKRDLTVKTLLQRAIALCPKRPEGYFFLARLHEHRKEFHDCYTMSCIGLDCPQTLDHRLPEYTGNHLLLFQKAIGAWWVGLSEESREIMFDLHLNYRLPQEYQQLVAANLQNLGFPKRKLIYQNSYLKQLRVKFPGVENIKNNYSQVFQDMFVLTVLNGKQHGTYLEIGASDPFYNNNTALLETEFGWTGLSLEINPEEVTKFKSARKNPIVQADATLVDFKQLLDNAKLPDIIDYLQVDCDPAEISFDILQRVLNTDRRFRVIHFEHDAYVGDSIRSKSRDLLNSKGYELRVPNVAFNQKNSFEDWWVISSEVTYDFLEFSKNDINFAMDVFFGQKANKN